MWQEHGWTVPSLSHGGGQMSRTRLDRAESITQNISYHRQLIKVQTQADKWDRNVTWKARDDTAGVQAGGAGPGAGRGKRGWGGL
jgi:hypothetical protein